MRYYLQDLKWQEVSEYLSRKDLILFPAGSVEQHGQHLPMITDSSWAIDVAESVAAREEVLISPPLPFGWSAHHMAYPGTITLKPETLTQVIMDVCNSLIFHGFKKILILNGHRVANLAPIEIAAAKLRNTTQAYVAVVDLALIVTEEIRQIFESDVGGFGHADEIETSFMLYKHPELVDMTKAGKNISPTISRFSNSFSIPDNALSGNRFFSTPTIEEWRKSTEPYGFKGDASLGTSEKGEKIFKAIVANVIEFIQEINAIEIQSVNKTAPF
ncbi:MAG: creatininase family protein [Deltaproteobacteria bacterium]|nr:creatininase family protein [Deltaproteobacteria bacterium]MBW2308928.1 creatininase family protein [Deltaproteobacteria bacterium]